MANEADAAFDPGKVPSVGDDRDVGGPTGFLRVLARRMEQEQSAKTLHREPEYIERQIGKIRAYTSYFSPEVRGTEHLPVKGPALLIGNHNGLAYMPDAWVTALAIVDRRGTEHPAYTLTYDLLFALPVVGPFLRRIGAIPASSEDAATALAEGALVLDYPGGDWEACRPWLDRNTIDFGGRTGFVRLALRAGVPAIPVVAHGSHDSVIVVSRGEAIARGLGLPSMHIKVFPIMLGPLGLTTAVFPPPPLPSSITVEFLPPINWGDLGPEAAEDKEVVDRCAAEVVEVMQSALDRLRVERAHPVRRGFMNVVSRAIAH
jgi:1-acyl-sn-glycerol-3-phosphate acyltransferase